VELREQASPVAKASGGARQERSRWRSDLAGFAFVLPFLAVYALFLIWPIILQLRMSFFDWSLAGTGTSDFLGLANYRELLGDPAFWSSLWHTVYFTILTTPALVILALILAMLTNRIRFMQSFFRSAFFAPFVLPASVMALIWIWLYQPGFGLINSYLISLGFAEVGWLSDSNIIMISIAIATVWWTIGFNYVLYLAGLQEIPLELYDAAAVDGASPLAQTRWITIPLLNRTTVLVIILQILASLKVFQQIYLLTLGSGGPNFSARPVIEYIYDQGFTSYRVGFASAMSTVFFLVILAFGALWFWQASRRERSV
jgi:multiple sugar transport system permease protein